jgi:hypothetical protein
VRLESKRASCSVGHLAASVTQLPFRSHPCDSWVPLTSDPPLPFQYPICSQSPLLVIVRPSLESALCAHPTRISLSRSSIPSAEAVQHMLSLLQLDRHSCCSMLILYGSPEAVLPIRCQKTGSPCTHSLRNQQPLHFRSQRY